MGAKVGETSRKHGVREPTHYKWKRPYSGMEVMHPQLRECGTRTPGSSGCSQIWR